MPPDPNVSADAAALRAALEAASGQPHELVETHISSVLLGPEFVYKLKKPVALGFVDFRSLAARRHCCEEEVRLNRRLAPGLYLGVVPVHGRPAAPSLDAAAGEVIDHAVRMRRFPAEAGFEQLLARGRLVPEVVDALADRLAAFHLQAPRAGRDGVPVSPHAVPAAVRETFAALRPALGAGADALGVWIDHEAQRLGPLFARRLAEGWVREGHGDLHLGNLVLLDGGPTAFDCIEFDPALRWIDVLCDVGFLVMDLWAQGRRDLGFRFLDRYLQHTGDHAGLPVLRLCLVYRALVRARVALLKGAAPAAPEVERYLALVRTLTRQPRAGRLMITHGLPGSGKSHHALALVEQCGAVRLRSDVERKRLFGLAAVDDSRARVPGGIYGGDATERTYGRMEALARIALAAGYPVIVDAAFLQRDERDRFHAIARELSCPFTILHCDAPLAILRQRVLARQAGGADPSEADVEVLERLHARQQTLQPDEQARAIDATDDAQALAQRWADHAGCARAV